MIERLIDCLTSYRPLVLAMTKVQLDALQQRIGTGRVTGMTFRSLQSARFNWMSGGMVPDLSAYR